jgi:O-antigen/teichoic acid export membrane protein
MANLGLAIHLLGSARYGHVTLVLAFGAVALSIASSFFTIAASAILNARSAGSTEGGIQTQIAGIWAFAAIGFLIVVLGGTVFGAEIVKTFVYWGPDASYADQLYVVVSFIGLASAFQIVTACNAALVEGRTRFDLSARMQLVAPIIVLASLGLAALGKQFLSVAAYSWILAAAAGVEMIVAWLLRARLSPVLQFSISTRGMMSLPRLLRGAGMLQGAQLANMFFDPLNKYLLNRFVGAASVTYYEAGMKVAMGIQGLFNGAFRTFLQLASGPAVAISSAYVQVIRMAWVPAALIHGAAAALLALVGQFFLSDEIAAMLPFFGAILPASLGIIFITPLYLVLIGTRDLGFILRMHIVLAVVNLLASLTLIPRFGLYGAAAGLVIATGYNVYAAFDRYIARMGPISGLQDALLATRARFLVAAAFAATSSFAVLVARSSPGYWVVESALLAAIVVFALREPVLTYALQRFRAAH